MPSPYRRNTRRPRLIERAPDSFYGGLVALDKATGTSDWTGVTVTADASAHTKGAYAELIASTSGRVTLIHVWANATFTAATDTSMLLDIATGTAGNEVDVVANIPIGQRVGWSANGHVPYDLWFPVTIPVGTRVAARIQSAVALGDTAVIQIETFGGGRETSGLTTMGANTTTSQGVSVAAGTSNNEGSWVEIEDATTEAYRGLAWSVGLAGDADAQSTKALLDIGIGAAGSEVAIITNFTMQSTSAESFITQPMMGGLIPYLIPVGSRLAARVQQASATAQSYDVVLVGIK